MPVPPTNLPFDKSKKRGVGDASAITKMRKVNAEVGDYQSKIGFTNRTLGSASKAGFVWSIHQPGLVQNYGLIIGTQTSSGSGDSSSLPAFSIELSSALNLLGISWPAVAGASRYFVTVSPGGFTQAVDNQAGQSSYSTTSVSLTLGTTYTVSVTASDDIFPNALTSTTTNTVTPVVPPASGYDIIVLAGQSNMIGRDGSYASKITLTQGANTQSESSSGLIDRNGINVQQFLLDKDANTGRLLSSDGNATITVSTTPFNVGNISPALYIQTGSSAPNANTASYPPLWYNDNRDNSASASPGPGSPANQAHGVSLGYEFVKYYAKYIVASGRTVLVVPCAVGATAMSLWIPGGELYTRMKQGLTNILALPGGTHKIAAFVWHQGESDMTVPLSANWATNVANMVSTFRTDMGTSAVPTGMTSIPFILGNTLYTWALSLGNTSGVTVNTAVDTIATTIPNCISVSSLGLHSKAYASITGDTAGEAHFSARGARLLGSRYFNAYLALNGVYQPPTTDLNLISLINTSLLPPTNVTGFSQPDTTITFNNMATDWRRLNNAVAYAITATQGATTAYALVTEYGVGGTSAYLPYDSTNYYNSTVTILGTTYNVYQGTVGFTNPVSSGADSLYLDGIMRSPGTISVNLASFFTAKSINPSLSVTLSIKSIGYNSSNSTYFLSTNSTLVNNNTTATNVYIATQYNTIPTTSSDKSDQTVNGTLLKWYNIGGTNGLLQPAGNLLALNGVARNGTGNANTYYTNLINYGTNPFDKYYFYAFTAADVNTFNAIINGTSSTYGSPYFKGAGSFAAMSPTSINAITTRNVLVNFSNNTAFKLNVSLIAGKTYTLTYNIAYRDSVPRPTSGTYPVTLTKALSSSSDESITWYTPSSTFPLGDIGVPRTSLAPWNNIQQTLDFGTGVNTVTNSRYYLGNNADWIARSLIPGNGSGWAQVSFTFTPSTSGNGFLQFGPSTTALTSAINFHGIQLSYV